MHGFIYDVYAEYAVFLGEPVMPTDRLEDYLANHAKRQHYLQDPFPDAGFSQMLLQALRERCESEKFELARALKDQAFRGMGGFEPAELGD